MYYTPDSWCFKRLSSYWSSLWEHMVLCFLVVARSSEFNQLRILSRPWSSSYASDVRACSRISKSVSPLRASMTSCVVCLLSSLKKASWRTMFGWFDRFNLFIISFSRQALSKSSETALRTSFTAKSLLSVILLHFLTVPYRPSPKNSSASVTWKWSLNLGWSSSAYNMISPSCPWRNFVDRI